MFNDNSFGVNDKDDFTLYEPYNCLMPSNQVKLLQLWDELQIPHKKKKQVFGSPLTIIGILVDPNEMTMTLLSDAKSDLIKEMRRFAESPKGKSKYFTKRAWQRLAGWVNWGLNVFPLLVPCLANIYTKINATGDNPHARIWSNKAIKMDLDWGANHMERLSGTHLLKSKYWDEVDADVVMESDACLTGMAFWFPRSRRAFFCPAPADAPKDLIFYLEALAVTSAFSCATAEATCPQKMIIYTDNMNTVNIFNMLHALPLYNPMLRHVVDIIINDKHKLSVRHIPGELNEVADLISCEKFDDARRLFPSLYIKSFQPPQSLLGVAKK